jgi:glycosyltransferase involved in cell wall biosynthesis
VAPHLPRQLIEPLPVASDGAEPHDGSVGALRLRLGLEDCRVVVYTGSFGLNQGLELAIEAMQRLVPRLPDVRLVLVGGHGRDFQRVRAYVEERDFGRTVRVIESQPPADMPAFMALADVLLSPRTEGTNTPLKVYSYLAAGKPIVATALATHMQVLSSETAELVPPTPEDLAAGICRVLMDPARAESLGRAARGLADQRTGHERHRRSIAAILERMSAPERTPR